MTLPQLRRLGAISVIICYLQIFYWLRLFSTFSLVIRVLYNTLKNIIQFTILLFIVIFAFSNAYYIIEFNLREAFYDDGSGLRADKAVLEEKFDSYFLDSVIQ